ncbi:hypothetical protein SteCoe_31464 [Stentor coeruleus]|uniref:Uncharacterized protein n=1 Tax=Stentor coeruleus TaxID=5963 RepID=A0A1R2B166_9CILI|nr:hypothetical protein SteCoe_31464 [Stentor coeruleus]
MDTNSIPSQDLISSADNITSRYSIRIRKPIQMYKPEFSSSKSKKLENTITCQILQAKGIVVNKKSVKFTSGSNLLSLSLCKRLLRELQIYSADYIFVHFCEKTKKWKKLSRNKVFTQGFLYKIRVYKKKKTEKKENAIVIKPQEQVKQEPMKKTIGNYMQNYAEIMMNMQWMYYSSWIASTYMNQFGYQ